MVEVSRKSVLVESLAWLIVAAAGAVILIMLIPGCALDTRQIAYEAARAAVDGVADRFGVPVPTDAVSPLQGLLGAGGMMLVYLIRKRFWPMGKR